MADDKGSDLDVFEGLAKKKPAVVSLPQPKAPPAQPTLRSVGAEIPPPSKVPHKKGVLPKASPPPSKGGGAVLPKPKLPPKKGTSDDAPEVLAVSTDLNAVFGNGPGSGSVLPGPATADLDWDDDDEATRIFSGKTDDDLFSDLSGRRDWDDPDDTSKRSVASAAAAALLKSSGRAAPPVAVPVPVPVPVPSVPAEEPRIPAPAPVPRELAPAPADSAPAAAPLAPAVAPPPPAKSSSSKLLLAAAVLLAIVVGAFFYLRSVGEALVTIEVTHQDKPIENAQIYIGGQKKCEFAPCELRLPPGKKEIRVVSQLLAGRKTIEIKGGQDVVIMIELDEERPAAEPTASAPEKQGPPVLVLKSSHKDLKVFINDSQEPKVLGTEGLELKDLAPGEVKLKFVGGEEYSALEKTVTLKAGETVKLEDIKLPLIKVKVTFHLLTTGAKVSLQEGDAPAKELAFTRFQSKIDQTLDTSKTWTVKAYLNEYHDFKETISFDDGKPELTFPIELKKKEEQVAVTPDGPPTTTGTIEPPPPPPPAGDFGFINANSIPPSKVVIAGTPRGMTPVMGVKVPAGSHQVMFIHRKYGTMSRTVTVAAGQTQTATVKFKKKRDED